MTISMVQSELKGVKGALFVADSTYIVCCVCIRPGPDQGCGGADITYIVCCICIRPGPNQGCGVELTALILFVAFVFNQDRTRGAEGADSTYIVCCLCIQPGPDQGCGGS